MTPDTVIGLVILSFVALVMILIGICQLVKKDEPVGFYNVIEAPKREEITDILQWNRKHGMMWILYGICIEAGFWAGFLTTVPALEIIFMLGGILLPLPVMIFRHHCLVRQYRRTN